MDSLAEQLNRQLSDRTRCPHCSGTGHTVGIEDSNDGGVWDEICVTCFGAGYIPNENRAKCDLCKGEKVEWCGTLHGEDAGHYPVTCSMCRGLGFKRIVIPAKSLGRRSLTWIWWAMQRRKNAKPTITSGTLDGRPTVTCRAGDLEQTFILKDANG